MRRRLLGALAASVTACGLAAPVALPAGSHPFRATYSGHAAGAASNAGASGSGTATGSGSPIGRGTLTGSGRGRFVSSTCVTFGGAADLSGTAATISITVAAGHACGDASAVSFSGNASVARGTGTFAGARGTLAFSGTFSAPAGTFTVTFHGRIRY